MARFKVWNSYEKSQNSPYRPSIMHCGLDDVGLRCSTRLSLWNITEFWNYGAIRKPWPAGQNSCKGASVGPRILSYTFVRFYPIILYELVHGTKPHAVNIRHNIANYSRMKAMCSQRHYAQTHTHSHTYLDTHRALLAGSVNEWDEL